MIVRPAGTADAPMLAEFLARHPATSMFLRQSLLNFGPEGGPERHAARFWCLGAPFAGTVALSTQGMLMMQAPGLTVAALTALRPVLAGREVEGMAGEHRQIAALRAALGLYGQRCQLDRDDPLCHLALADLRLPRTVARLRPAVAADTDWLTEWRHAYMVEALGAPGGPAARAGARTQVEGLIAADRLRVLGTAEGPVAITAFNAVLPDIVQVGGVYTPPGLRGRGYARTAVGLHLAEARAAGASEAILFAAGPAALRAYFALGFQRIGAFRLVMFDGRVTLPAP